MVITETTIGVLGLIATVIIGFLGSFGLYWNQRRDRRRKLRKALRSEINAMSDIENMAKTVTESGIDFDGWPFPHTSPIINEVYSGNTSDVGILSDSEVDKVVEYYSLASDIERGIEAVHAEREDALSQKPFMTIHKILYLNNLRGELLSHIADKLDEDTAYRDEYYYVNLEEWTPKKIANKYG